MPMRLRARRSSWPARGPRPARAVRSWPATVTVPAVGRSRRLTQRMSEDLPAPVLADDAVHLAFADVQVDAVEGGDLTAARAVDLREAGRGDHRGFRHCRVRGRGCARTRERRDARPGVASRTRMGLWYESRGVSTGYGARTCHGGSLRGARLRGWCEGPLEGAHSTHTTSTGRQGRLGRKGAAARSGHAISKADVWDAAKNRPSTGSSSTPGQAWTSDQPPATVRPGRARHGADRTRHFAP